MRLIYYLYLLFFLVFIVLSCNENYNEEIQNSPLSNKDSILLNGLLDSLSKNYSDNDDELLCSSDFIASNFKNNLAEVNTKIALIHYSKANYLLTEHYFKKSAQIYLNDSLLGKYAEQLSNIGVMKEMTGSYTEATKIYFEAIEIFNRLNLELKSSRIYNNLGIVYQQLNESDKALNYYRKSLLISEKLNRPDISAKRYNNIAVIYEEAGIDLDSALYYYQKAYNIWQKDSNSYFLPIVENNIGYIYLLKNELAMADSLFKKAMDFCLSKKQKNGISQIKRNQAKLLVVLKKYDLAIDKIQESISLAKKNSNKEIQLEGLEVLISALEKSSQYRKANKVIKDYYKLQEELSGIEQKKQINHLTIQFQLKEKEHKIQILVLQNNVQNRKLLLQGLFILGLIILLAALFFVFRLHKKNNELKLIQMQRAISDYISQIEEIKENNIQSEDIRDESFKIKLKELDLTDREVEVLILISKGYKNTEIAKKMFVSVNTIKTHTKNIFIKLDVRNRTEAARKAKLF